MFEVGDSVKLKIAHSVYDDETLKDIERYEQGAIGNLIAIEDGYYIVKLDNGTLKTRSFYLEPVNNA